MLGMKQAGKIRNAIALPESSLVVELDVGSLDSTSICVGATDGLCVGSGVVGAAVGSSAGRVALKMY